MISGLPLDDLRNLLRKLPAMDATAAEKARARNGAAGESGFDPGRAGRIAEWLSAWSGRHPPIASRAVVCLFVGTHAVARQAVSSHAAGFERRFVEHAAAGGAPVNQLCGASDLGLKVFDLALDLPVGDITLEPALEERACAATVAFGMEAIAGGADLLCLGGVGAGGEVAAAALMMVLVGGEPSDWLEDAEAGLYARQLRAVEAALSLHGRAANDPLEAMRRLGGREIAALTGAIVAARMERVPVVLDGKAALAAAAVLSAVTPGAADHCLVADAVSPPLAKAARHLELDVALEWGLAAGDGAAAAMGAILVKNAALMHDQTVPLPAGG